ncbi:MAG TPA: VOC family protein [Chloroflexi bacterium]|jgi:PhnB protein|nr:VOC family protein [Chloroflexota bacterium]
MSLGVYLNFNGNCREAVEFYTDVFGVERPQIMTYADAPPEMGMASRDDALDLVMHTSFKLHGTDLMFSDITPEMSLTVGNNVGIIITSDDKDEITRWFNALKEGGIVEMELQETFWSPYYGAVIDKFGISWQFNYVTEAEREAESMRERERIR